MVASFSVRPDWVVLVLAVLSLWAHELGHAWAAKAVGDRFGRMRWRANPLANLDPVLSLLVPLLTWALTGVPLGMGRPLLVDRMDWRIAAAGPGVNLWLAAFAYAAGFERMVAVNLALGLFNALPIPPLDGAAALRAWREERRTGRVRG